MRQQLLKTLVACAAGLALSAQAQSSSSPSSSPGGTSTDPSSGSSGSSSTYPSTSGSQGASSYGGAPAGQAGWAGHRYSATGRMGQEPVKGSQLTGAPVNGSSGSQIGTISDTIINPASGRLEFAVISLSGESGASTGSSASSTPSSTGISSSGSTSLGSGKQVAVPWMLLRTSSAGASSSAAASSAIGSQQQPSFTFAGEASKLQSAPNFDATTDLSQPSWRQSIFSHFGLGGSSPASGAAETPGGFSGSSSQSPSGSSSSTSPDSSSSQQSTTPQSSPTSK